MRLTFKGRRLLVTVVSLAAIAFGFGASPARAADTSAAQPTPTDILKGLRLDAGFLQDFRAKRDDAIYYKLSYKGNTVKEHGSAPKESDATGGVTVPKAEKNDVPQLDLRIERGNAAIDGGLFNLLGTQNIRLDFLRDVRGALQASGRLDGKQFNLAAGLESPPIVPLHALGLDPDRRWTNWIVFGAQGERQEKRDALGGDSASGLLTYRAFFGRVIGWANAEGRDKTAQEDFEAVLSLAPTYDDARKQYDTARKMARKNRSKAQNRLISFISAHEALHDLTNENYRDQLHAYLFAKSLAKELPRNLLYIESTGWYTLTDDLGGANKRFNNLFAFTLEHYLRPSEENGPFLRLRYENGRERAAPTAPKNQVILSVGVWLKK